MTTAAKNSNERLIDQIDEALPNLPEDDEFDSKRVLTYIRGEISAEGIAKRAERADPSVDENVGHLHQVAHEHLRRLGREAV